MFCKFESLLLIGGLKLLKLAVIQRLKTFESLKGGMSQKGGLHADWWTYFRKVGHRRIGGHTVERWATCRLVGILLKCGS